MKDARAAASFLTRVRLGGHAQDSSDLALAVPWFPLVGLAIGALVAAVYVVGSLAWPTLVAATIAVGAHAVLTGGLHEDGLADVGDAFGGNWGKEKSLAILKDPRHGTYGVVTLTVALLLRIGCLATLDAVHALAVVPAAHALSRSAAVGLMGALPPATTEGSGAAYTAALTRRQVTAALALASVVALVLLGIWALAAGLAAIGAAVLMGRISKAKIGGTTGDVLGATQQVAEVSILLVAASFATSDALVLWWE